ncbi:MAG: hypothetical protein M1814_000954 [Vezdaea aestivalis]|nr:MAG: hypothetical protein M1814_000954 [Vezdaea aestivalis]
MSEPNIAESEATIAEPKEKKTNKLQLGSSDQLWTHILVRKQDELRMLLALLERKAQRKSKHADFSTMHIASLEEAIHFNDLESFQHAILMLAENFSKRKVSVLISKYLFPSLDHIRSFSVGISAATQYDKTASLVWGMLYIVIQCGCMFAESIDEILLQLAELQDLLPYFQKDLTLYPTSKALQYCLRSIFEDYINFCLEIIRHFCKHPLWVFMRNLVSSSLRQNLKKLKGKLRSDVAEFDRAVDSADRTQARRADEAMLQKQDQILSGGHQSFDGRIYGTPRPKSDSREPNFPIHLVNIPENHDFIGREMELEALHTILVKDHSEAKPKSCAIHGMGGIGKTETALKFTYQYRNCFDAVFWVSADPEQETETLRTFGNIGRRLNMFDSDAYNDPEVDVVLHWLETTDRRWLLVYDNAEKWGNISRYWPTRSRYPSAIIITAQKESPWVNRNIDLEPLPDHDGSKLLLQQMHLAHIDQNDPTRNVACEISKELGGSPLYLTHAYGYMSLSGCPPQEYLESIRTQNNALDWKSNATWRYGKAVSTTHDRILKQLSFAARQLLFMLAFMNPDAVNEDLVLIRHEDKDLQFLNDKSTYLSYIAELREARLVQRDTNNNQHVLRMHRATQAAMLHRLCKVEEERNLSFSRVIHLIRDNFEDPSIFAKLQIAEAHAWPKITKVLPHLLSAYNFFEKSWPDTKGTMFFAQLLYDVAGMDLYDRGWITETYKINKLIQKLLISFGPPFESRLMADSLSMIGMCTDFMALSKRQEGLEIRKRCVTIREKCFADIPPNMITREDRIWLHNGYTDLVCSQQQINDFDNARQNLDKCFENYQLWGGEDDIPYEYSKYYNQMAYVLLYQNESKKAVEYAKKGYELVEKATPGALIAILYKFDYANILFQHGDAEGARKKLEEILKVCKLDCGKDNIRTFEIRLNIGIVSYFMKDLPYAEKKLRKALRMNKTELWPPENVVRGKFYLSQVLKEMKPNTKEAMELESEAKESLEKLLEMDKSGQAADYHADLPLLFDYLVHWECRLTTPRRKA